VQINPPVKKQRGQQCELNNDVKHPYYVFHDDFLKANLLNLCLRFSHVGNVDLLLLILLSADIFIIKGEALNPYQSVIAQ